MLEIWFWSNLFMGWSRFRGVTGTVSMIRWLVEHLPPKAGSLEMVSDKVSRLHRRFPFLFVGRRQKCLIRGFLLLFYAKRMGLDVLLRFGCRWEGDALKTHCWIVRGDVSLFEVADVLDEYETLVEYA
jgi:hypothetical protein